MLPLKDRNPTERTAYLTLAIIGLNVAVFLILQKPFDTSNEVIRTSQGTIEAPAGTTFIFCHALIPWEFANGKPLAQGGADAEEALRASFGSDGGLFLQLLDAKCPDKSVWFSFLSSMFMHGGWLHIAGNMLFLWVFGNNVEDKIGPVGYLVFYLAAGVIAAFTHIFSGAQSAVPTVGASGAIAGVLGAYLVMFPRRRVVTLLMFFFITVVEIPAYVLLGFWFVLQFFQGIASIGGDVTSVAVWAHVGGFAAGVLAALALFPKERGDPNRPAYPLLPSP
ncbi:MAG TPA: rhomboid family intramembrane serine protease [Actinomycetota bacterium]|nr:rhomboid family intramembrane serine protease [Actinomycetota bacterium]